MGRNDDNENRMEWAATALRGMVESGLTPEAVASAFLHVLAGSAPSRSAFGALIADVIVVAEQVNDMIKPEAEPEPEPELPDEVLQAMAMLGIDPSQVSVVTPRSTGAKAAAACDCNRCVVEEAKAGFLVKDVGEA
jgi:beta-phosphoglucomutase-like phosphatase (HAD superfamily)